MLREHRMCLCGMLAAEFRDVAAADAGSVVRFFDANEAWLARVSRPVSRTARWLWPTRGGHGANDHQCAGRCDAGRSSVR